MRPTDVSVARDVDKMQKQNKIKILDEVKKNKTRALWEEIFHEDSQSFVDYYYACKIPHNITYGGEKKTQQEVEADKLVSMLHLTPYVMEGKNGQCFDSFYVVGVGTKEAYRHQGLMQDMLTEALSDCNKRKIPFVFLMPASPLIYEPYDFSYIYDRDEYEWCAPKSPEEYAVSGEEVIIGQQKENNAVYFKITDPEEYEEIAEFSNGILREWVDYFCLRSKEYYETMEAELKSQKGHIIGIYKKNAGLQGILLYAMEEKVFIQELLCKQKDLLSGLVRKVGEKPIIMARITHMASFLELFYTKGKEVMLTFGIRDKWVKENEGIYEWHVTDRISEAVKTAELSAPEETVKNGKIAKEKEDIPVFEISELLALLFGRKSCQELENGRVFGEIVPWKRGHINEIV